MYELVAGLFDFCFGVFGHCGDALRRVEVGVDGWRWLRNRYFRNSCGGRFDWAWVDGVSRASRLMTWQLGL